MKLLKYRSFLFLFCIALLGTCFEAGASIKQEFVKSIIKEFDISPDGEVGLRNKRGKIDVRIWDQNRVKIDVKITVITSSQSRANDVFDQISIDFTNGQDYVKAQTQIKSSGSWWSSWTWGGARTQYTIDYIVHIPKTINLDIDNNYGDVLVMAIDGSARVALDYGDLRMDGVKNDLELDLSYGSGTVLSVKDATIDNRYFDIRFKEAKDLNFKSSYSDIKIERAGDVRAESRYADFIIKEVRSFKDDSRYGGVSIEYADNLEAIASYRDYEITELSNIGNFDLRYGDVEVASLAKGFKEFIMKGGYADCTIDVEDGAVYQLDCVTSYGHISFPSNLKISSEIDKNHSHSIKGTMGAGQPRSLIKVELSYGDLKLE